MQWSEKCRWISSTYTSHFFEVLNDFYLNSRISALLKHIAQKTFDYKTLYENITLCIVFPSPFFETTVHRLHNTSTIITKSCRTTFLPWEKPRQHSASKCTTIGRENICDIAKNNNKVSYWPLVLSHRMVGEILTPQLSKINWTQIFIL